MPEDDDYESLRAYRLSNPLPNLTEDEAKARHERVSGLVRSKPALPDPAIFGVSTEAPASVMVEDSVLTVQGIMHERAEAQV